MKLLDILKLMVLLIGIPTIIVRIPAYYGRSNDQLSGIARQIWENQLLDKLAAQKLGYIIQIP